MGRAVKMLLNLLHSTLTCLLVCHFIDYIEQNLFVEALMTESKELFSGKVLRAIVFHVSLYNYNF